METGHCSQDATTIQVRWFDSREFNDTLISGALYRDETVTATRRCQTRKRAFNFYSPRVVRRSHSAAAAAAAAKLLWINLKIRLGGIAENSVFNLYTKFNDDQLWNEKALVLTTRRRTTLVAIEDPFPGPKRVIAMLY